MAAVVPFASCYGGGQPRQLFGRGPRGSSYLSLLAYRGPGCTPRPRLTYRPPRMTLRQICHMLKVMKQETRVCISDPGGAWQQVGEEGPPELPQAQTQPQTCWLTCELWLTAEAPHTPACSTQSGATVPGPSHGEGRSDDSAASRATEDLGR